MDSIRRPVARELWPAFLQLAPDGFDWEPAEHMHVVRCRRCWLSWTLEYNRTPEDRQAFVGTLAEHDRRHASPAKTAP